MSEPTDGQRWVPTRAGILNIWRYYDEVFQFHNGRLLLRGRNGSGKSKALELLLPYLLDADLKPSRLSTFGHSDRSMHWNLMGQGVETATRVGYVWLELRRGPADPAGADGEWFTCGVRLAATRSTTRVQADYFTTSRRIGVPGGVELLNETRQPATRAQLSEVLAGSGEVHDSAERYRAAVRRTLYPGMDPQRYASLLLALLQLRRPKLSERLDPNVLSTLLSDSLPPVDAEEIAQLAEGFERLDKQREHLVALDREVQAARVVAERARTYARRRLRAGAVELAQAASTMDTLARRARDSRAEHGAALARRAQLHEELGAVRVAVDVAAAQLHALEESQEYRAGRQLDELRVQLAQRQRAVEDARGRFERTRSEAAAASADADTQKSRWAQAAQHVATTLPGIRAAAGQAGLGALWERAEAQVEPPGTGEHLLELVRPAVRSRLGQVAQTLAVLGEHEASVERRTTAEDARELAQQRADDAARDVRAATQRTAGALSDLHEELGRWIDGGWLPGLAADELVELAADDTRDPERPIAQRVEQAAAPLRAELSEELRRTRNRLDGLAGRRADVGADLAAVQAQRELAPEPPRFRTAARPADAGAPLWRLVRFREGVPDTVQAAAEAALEAAGLLDAWVSAPGAARAPGHDSWLDPAGLLPLAGASLIDIMQPEQSPMVPAEVVERILAAIGWAADGSAPGGAPGASAIATDQLGSASQVGGLWRLGGLSGSWAKPTSQHIGATARRLARERRIAELSALIAELDGQITVAVADLAQVDQRIADLAARVAAMPDLAPLRAARALLAQVQAHQADRLTELAAARDNLAARQAEAAASSARMKEIAAGHGLPESRVALQEVRERIEEFRERANDLTRAIELRQERNGQLAQARSREASAVELHESDTLALAVADREAATAGARLAALQDAVGASYDQILARIDQARSQRGAALARDAQLQDELRSAEQEVGRLEDGMARDEQARDQATAARDRAADSLRWLLAATLGADAEAPVQWRATTSNRETLDAARAINERWANVVHEPRNITEAVGRLNEAVHGNRDSLASRAIIGMAATDAGQVLEVTMNGVGIGAADLLAALQRERDEASTALTSEERDLFDRILTGDTRRHLADRLRRARELVDSMNSRLARIRTASGIGVRITWQVDPQAPAETKAARSLLLKDAAMLSSDDREALHTFLRARIDQARAANTSASWQEQLADVFDYTAWHRFLVDIRRGDGQWSTLTPRQHGVLSGGEKAIVLHLPLFAAVAAHYESVPAAPRFILLDEVFVGVDQTNRGQIFRLMSELDLDLVLTSDHEWCTYAELDGISIYQLITEADDDPVTTAHFVWNGRHKVAFDPVSDGVLDFG